MIERGRVEQEVAALLRGQPDPAGDQHAQNVTMGEESDVPLLRAHPGDHTIDPSGHLLRTCLLYTSDAADE